MFAGVSAGLVVREIISIGREFEILRAQLFTVTGSQGAAEQAFDSIKKFAASTPFEVNKITESFIRLKAVGIDPTLELLTSAGDIAAANGRDILQFSEAIVGAVTGEMERLKQFGIVARQQGDEVTFIFKGTETKVKKNSEAIVNALLKIGQTEFAGGMERQAQTLTGKLSNLSDAWASLADTIFQTAMADLLKQTTGAMTRLVESIDAYISRGKTLETLLDRLAPKQEAWRKELMATAKSAEELKLEELRGQFVQLVVQLERLQKFEQEGASRLGPRMERVQRAMREIQRQIADVPLQAGIDRLIAQLDSTGKAGERGAQGLRSFSGALATLPGISLDLPLIDIGGFLTENQEAAAATLAILERWGIELKTVIVPAAQEFTVEIETWGEAQEIINRKSDKWVNALFAASDAFRGMNSEMGDLLQGLSRGVAMAIEMARQIKAAGGGKGVQGLGAGLAFLQGSGIDFGQTGSSILGGASAGFAAGAAFGPQAAAIGAAVGAFVGFASDLMSNVAQTYGRLESEAGRLIPVVLEGSGQLARATKSLLDGIAAYLNAIADLFGADAFFAAIGVQIREDSKGIRVWVEDILIGTFESLQEAQEAAVLAAVQSGQFDGISSTTRLAIDEFVGSSLQGLMDAVGNAMALVDPSDLVGRFNVLFGIGQDRETLMRAEIAVLKAEVEIRIASLKAREAELLVMQAHVEAQVSIVQLDAEVTRAMLETAEAGARGIGAFGEVMGAAGIVAGVSAETIAGALAAVRDALAALQGLDFSEAAIQGALANLGGAITSIATVADTGAEAVRREIEILEQVAAGRQDLADAMMREDEITQLMVGDITRLEAIRLLELRAIRDAQDAMAALVDSLQSAADAAASFISGGDRGLAAQIQSVQDEATRIRVELFNSLQGVVPNGQAMIDLFNDIGQIAGAGGGLDEVRRFLEIQFPNATEEWRNSVATAMLALSDLGQAGEEAANRLARSAAAGISPALAAMDAQARVQETISTLAELASGEATKSVGGFNEALFRLAIVLKDATLAAQAAALAPLSGVLGFGTFLAEALGDQEALIQLEQDKFRLQLAQGGIQLQQARLLLEVTDMMSPVLAAAFDRTQALLDAVEADLPDILAEIGAAAGPGGQSVADILGELTREAMPQFAGQAVDMIEKFHEMALALEAQNATEGERLLLLAHMQEATKKLNDESREGIRSLQADIQAILVGPRAAFLNQQGIFSQIFGEILGASDIDRLDLLPRLAASGRNLLGDITGRLGGAGTTVGGRALRDLADALDQANALPEFGVDPLLSATQSGLLVQESIRDLTERSLTVQEETRDFLRGSSTSLALPPATGGGDLS